ncbi:MAG: hypothetical protein EHM23_03980 [Acidobacteria bacterium]|nr:MAG: hypothetical protein EHM23_03980 [Acidobacteriota bacterium]
MSNQRSIVPLVIGVLLVVLGGLFLAINVFRVDLNWLQVIRFGIPAFLLFLGVAKLVRHFTWDAAKLQENHAKSSLLGGLFWAAVGTIGLLDFFGALNFFSFFGSYWPGLLILFGIGKIIDFYRFSGGLQFRASEVVGVLALMLLGFVAGKIGAIDPGFRAFADWPHGWVFEEENRVRARIESHQETSAAGIEAVQIDNRFGDIQVETGLEDKIDVGLTAVVRGESERRAQEIGRKVELSLQREGKLVKIGTNRAETQDRNYPLSTHLRVLVPKQAQVKIGNENGSVTVQGINGALQISNSYGPLTIESITGSVDAKNRYAAITVRNIKGDVTIENRRGQIRLEEITGNVKAATDYERVDAEQINGPLEVVNHFGDVRVRTAEGPVTIKSPGSGVDVSSIKKSVYIENSHKGVRVAELADTLELDTSYGGVSLSRIDGAVIVRASSSDISAKDIRKGITIQGSGSKVALAGVEGPVKIATSLKRVAVERFTGPAEVQNEYGEIVLTPDAPLTGSLVASNRNGEITLSLPPEASCRLSAQAPGGEVESEFGQAERAEKSPMFEQTIGGGKSEVRLQTTYSRIRIRKSD